MYDVSSFLPYTPSIHPFRLLPRHASSTPLKHTSISRGASDPRTIWGLARGREKNCSNEMAFIRNDNSQVRWNGSDANKMYG
jgi:hypothetical protein